MARYGRRLVGRVFHRIYELVITKCIKQVFLIDGMYFDQFFLVHECLEVTSQVYQAYRSSIFISTRWINNLIVTMVFINCLSTPTIHWLIPGTNPSLRRVVSVTVSSFLNFVNSVVIPLVIFLPYVHEYDPSTHYFSHVLVWNDVWWVKAVSENEQLFVTSYPDYVTTLLPHWSIFNCLRVCESMLKRQASTTSNDSISVVPIQFTPSSPKPPSSAMLPSSSKCSTCAISFKRLVYAYLVLSGCVVLGIHIDAQSTREVLGCRLHATPWLGHNSSCTVLNINCYRRGIEGSQQEIHEIFKELSSDTLFTVIFTHCPRLQMPPSFRGMKRLQVVEIYNCTLDQWDASASIRQQDLPAVSYITISRSVIPTIPPGMLDVEMASLGIEIVFFETNVSSLPSTVAAPWAGVWSLWCVTCQLKEFPRELSLIQWIFPDNPLGSIDLNVFDLPGIYFLDFSSTLVSDLPNETSSTLDELRYLRLEHSQVKEVPLFVRQWYADSIRENNLVFHSLHGTPYCSKEISKDDVDQIEYQQQVCAHDDRWGKQYYPIEIIEPQREL